MTPPDMTTVERARESVVLAIAFLGRDAGTDRMVTTVPQVIDELAKADAALAALPQPANMQPVAWLAETVNGKVTFTNEEDVERVQNRGIDVVPLYAAPPQPAGERAERREEIARDAQDAVRRIAGWLSDYGWTPRRSHIEAARNDLQKIADAILALPREPGEAWRGIETIAVEMDREAENISPLSGRHHGCAYPAMTIRNWAKRLRLLLPSPPIPNQKD